jgi:probable FeS assembly SUF system protein SufT
MNSSDTTTLLRDVDAIQIPSGTKMTLEKGLDFFVRQSLGGTITLETPKGLYRIDSNDVDAIGRTVKDEKAVSEAGAVDEKAVYTQLRRVYDPEIPVNVVDLGLIYDCLITAKEDNQHEVLVKMTLTAPGCGMGPTIAEDARRRILELESVTEANVEIVWDPPWNQSMISDVGKMQLGLM